VTTSRHCAYRIYIRFVRRTSTNCPVGNLKTSYEQRCRATDPFRSAWFILRTIIVRSRIDQLNETRASERDGRVRGRRVRTFCVRTPSFRDDTCARSKRHRRTVVGTGTRTAVVVQSRGSRGFRGSRRDRRCPFARRSSVFAFATINSSFERISFSIRDRR